MVKKNGLIKSLAIIGTLLVSIPVLAPIIFSLIRLIQAGRFQFDYLMPAELGLGVLIGAGLLLWAAIWSRSHVKWIAWCLGIAVLLVVGGQALAMATGLASGATEATGWRLALVLGAVIGYDLAVVALAIGGILLCIGLFRGRKQ